MPEALEDQLRSRIDVTKKIIANNEEIISSQSDEGSVGCCVVFALIIGTAAALTTWAGVTACAFF